MKLSKLVNKLAHRKLYWISQENTEQDIYSCKILEDGFWKKQAYPPALKPGVLYLCDNCALISPIHAPGISFLWAPEKISPGSDSHEAVSKYRSCGCNLISAKKPILLKDLLDETEEILIRQTILTDRMSRLLQVLHQNLGLQALIDAAYDLLDNPILAVDLSFKILASCQNVVEGRPDLEAQKAYGYILDSNIQAIKKARLYEKARKSRYPIYNKEPNAKEGWITALVYIHGIEAGHIAVSDSNHPFSDDDFEIIDFLCQLTSIELQKTDFYRANESMMHSFFLSELLDHHVRDMPTILRRAQSLGWNLGEYLRIMTVFQEHSEVFDKKAQLISKQVHQLFPGSRWVIYDGHIVFLLSPKSPELTEFRGDNDLGRYLEANGLTASLSRCFHSLTDTRQFYQETLAAYQLGQRFRPGSVLYIYTDYVCQHIGGILAERYSLSSFYHPAIEKIRAYDREHRTALLDTLKEYLAHPDNPGLAAKHLFIHKNTMFYRMAKIKELFSLDLSNGEERLNLHLSLKFMELES